MNNDNNAIRFNFDESVIHDFTDGDCWKLALQLHKLTDLPLCLTIDDASTNDNFGLGWTHAFMKLDEDQYLDIEGIKTRDEMLSQFYADQLVEVTLEDCLNDHFVGFEQEFESDPKVYAKKIVELLEDMSAL